MKIKLKPLKINLRASKTMPKSAPAPKVYPKRKTKNA
jgi:hypothetical protein